MYISQLRLIAYGPFTNNVLEFESRPGRRALYIVHGRNEAGKSSALKALRHVLFGFPRQTDVDFVHSYGNLRVGATLVSEHAPLSFVRRKRDKTTLYSSDDKTPLDDNALRPILGGIKENEYFQLFAMGHDSLRTGGNEIVERNGRLEELQWASTGLSTLLRIEKSLSKEADELFRPRASNPRINNSIKEIDALKKALDQQLQSRAPDKYRRLADELEERRSERDAVRSRLGELGRETRRLERISRALPAVGRLREYEKQRSQLGETPQLADGFTAARETLQSEARSLAGKLGEIERARQSVAEQLDEIVLPAAILEVADEVSRLNASVEKYRQARDDSRDRLVEAAVLEGEALNQLRSIRPELSLTNADSDSICLTKLQQLAIRELSDKLRELQTSIYHKEGTIRKQRLRDAEIANELDQFGEQASAEQIQLKDAVKRAGREGDLEATLAELQTERATIEQRLETGIAALARWSGTAEELERLPVPSVATIDRFGTATTALESESKRLHERRQKLENEVGQIKLEMDRAARAGDVPTLESLHESRSARDGQWRQFRRQLESEKPESPVDASRLNDYEETVRHADTTADRLRNEAERVEQLAQLQRAAERQRQDLTELEAAQTDWRSRRDQLDSAWQAEWPFLTDPPLPPREMRDWLQRHSPLKQDAERLRSVTQKATALAGRIDELKTNLLAALRESRSEAVAVDELHLLLDLAEERLEACQKAAEDRRSRLDERKRLLRDRDETAAELDSLRGEWQRQRTEWNRAVAPLGQPEDVSVEQGLAVLDTISDLVVKITEIKSLRTRIGEMLTYSESFESDVRTLARRIDADLDGQTCESVVATLVNRLKDAESLHDRQTSLRERLETSETNREETSFRRKEIHDQLQDLCRQARCDDPDELPAVEQRVAERRRIDQAVDQATQEILDSSGGRPLEEFQNEINSIDTDDIGGRLEEQNRREGELQDRRESLAAEITRLEAEIKQMDGGADAATTEEEMQSVVTRLMSDVEEYAKRKFALKMLRDGRERYHKQSGNELLDRASDYFRDLTCGSFARLDFDYDDGDEQQLQGIRADGTLPQRVPVSGMSDGTSDQLYLALRLAGLSLWFETHPPLPFIVDDILVHFDDSRSAAALAALSRLSQQTQVILFTHHEHVVELARRTLGDEGVHVHTLGDDADRAGDAPDDATGRPATPALF
ncbi:MAG: AAA family ATPase [Planctomycetaceae bacterium]